MVQGTDPRRRAVEFRPRVLDAGSSAPHRARSPSPRVTARCCAARGTRGSVSGSAVSRVAIHPMDQIEERVIGMANRRRAKAAPGGPKTASRNQQIEIASVHLDLHLAGDLLPRLD